MESENKELSLETKLPLCTGCQACEVACSFYLKGVCAPALSKIRITRDNETGRVFCDLPASCPECSFETEPACVASCPTGALTIKGDTTLETEGELL